MKGQHYKQDFQRTVVRPTMLTCICTLSHPRTFKWLKIANIYLLTILWVSIWGWARLGWLVYTPVTPAVSLLSLQWAGSLAGVDGPHKPYSPICHWLRPFPRHLSFPPMSLSTGKNSHGHWVQGGRQTKDEWLFEASIPKFFYYLKHLTWPAHGQQGREIDSASW